MAWPYDFWKRPVRKSLALLAAAAFLQCSIYGFFLAGDVLHSEFWSYADEPAHIVSSIMIADYLKQPLGTHPMQFAEAFYRQYPKVAVGHWPPMYHALLGSWLWLFGISPQVLLAFAATISMLTALLLFCAARRWLHWGAALLVALLYVSIPKVQVYSASIMTENLIALFSFCAVLSYASYCRNNFSTRYAVLFGVFASAAILYKGGRGWLWACSCHHSRSY